MGDGGEGRRGGQEEIDAEHRALRAPENTASKLVLLTTGVIGLHRINFRARHICGLVRGREGREERRRLLQRRAAVVSGTGRESGRWGDEEARTRNPDQVSRRKKYKAIENWVYGGMSQQGSAKTSRLEVGDRTGGQLHNLQNTLRTCGGGTEKSKWPSRIGGWSEQLYWTCTFFARIERKSSQILGSRHHTRTQVQLVVTMNFRAIKTDLGTYDDASWDGRAE